MESSGIAIIIHLQISMILFHDFFYAFEPKAMSSFIFFMRYRRTILIVYRGISAGIYDYNNDKRRLFFFLYGKLNKRIGNIIC